jgi:hypothetical protein
VTTPDIIATVEELEARLSEPAPGDGKAVQNPGAILQGLRDCVSQPLLVDVVDRPSVRKAQFRYQTFHLFSAQDSHWRTPSHHGLDQKVIPLAQGHGGNTQQR